MPPSTVTFRDLIERVLPLEDLPVGPRRAGKRLLDGFAVELGRAGRTPHESAPASGTTVAEPNPPRAEPGPGSGPAPDAILVYSRATLPLEARARLDRVRRLLRVEEPVASDDPLQPSAREALIGQLTEAGRELLGAHELRFVPHTGEDAGSVPEPDLDPDLMREALTHPERLYYCPDTSRSPRLAGEAARGLVAVVLAGVVGRDGDMLGLLEIASRKADSFGAEELALAALLADSCAAVLERAARIEKLMFIDPLTSAYNRSYFDLQVRNEMARAAREKSSMALCIVDIDDFKLFNSSFGYEGGNQVLKNVAESLRRAVRPFDTVARWGGEEFGVLLTSPLNAQDAATISERLRSMVEREVVRIESLDRQSRRATVTVSIGVALFPDNENTNAELWRAANQALLEAKRPPKNRVVFYRPPEGPPLSKD